MNPMEYFNTIGKSLAAISFNVLAIVTSMHEEFEHWLQVTSLIVSIAVGVLTIWWLIIKIRGSGRGR